MLNSNTWKHLTMCTETIDIIKNLENVTIIKSGWNIK